MYQAGYIYKYQVKPGRWVFVPDERSRGFGRALKDLLGRAWTAPSYYYHLKPGGHLEALRAHLNGHEYLRVDIDNFFGRISRSRVTRVLKKFMPYYEARRYAKLSVVPAPGRRGSFILPYGFVQSPILASISLRNSALGIYLDRLHHHAEEVTVSVYVDDILISSLSANVDLQRILSELIRLARLSRLDLSSEKITGPCSQISAFNIDIGGFGLRINRERLQKMIREITATSSKHARAGVLSYIRSVCPDQARLVESIAQRDQGNSIAIDLPGTREESSGT